MAEYIERESAIEAIMSDPPDAHYPSWYIDRIKTLSAADVAPVVHGRRAERMNNALLSSKNMCWCTPQDFFDALNEEFGFVSDPAARSVGRKELFNMKKNKHGFEPKQEFTMGGIAWTVIQTGANWVKCITSECVEERAFDAEKRNDFAASDICAYLNGEFLRRLIKAGAPEEMFEYFHIKLTADDLKNYGGDRVRIGLITCEEYRLLRGNIPALPYCCWWTATPDSPINTYVHLVFLGGSLLHDDAFNGSVGVRPLCNLKSEILVSYLNGEQAEQQKQRTEAVDMMKHIAAAWDIDAEEVLGRADE